MSDHPQNHFFSLLPSLSQFPDNNHSLKLINTLNVLPQGTEDDIDLPAPPLHPEDSLSLRIHPPPTTPSTKRKKMGCTCKKTFCLKMYC